MQSAYLPGELLTVLDELLEYGFEPLIIDILSFVTSRQQQH